jgi:hypothetical protein
MERRREGPRETVFCLFFLRLLIGLFVYLSSDRFFVALGVETKRKPGQIDPIAANLGQVPVT